MNRWSIPAWLEKEVRERDKACVYCGIDMLETPPLQGPRKAVATWEHIINDARLICRENIARCCAACNSSKVQEYFRSGLSRNTAKSTESPTIPFLRW